MLFLALPVAVGCLALQSQLHERVELHGLNAASYDWLGEAVAMEGTRILSGAKYDNDWEGSARLFERGPDGTWAQLASLRAADRAPDHLFGESVALSGDRALIGAWGANAAYVFERHSGNAWIQTAKLVGDPQAVAFGSEVALAGEMALIGAPDSSEAGTNSGSAYVFRHNPDGSWSQVAKLIASDATGAANFGHAVALEGDRALVCSLGSDLFGAVYVFDRGASGVWLETAKLVSDEPPLAPHLFGQSVALSGARLLVGDRAAGKAHVFEPNPDGEWERVATLRGNRLAYFGYDVALSGERAVIGAYWGPSAHLFERTANGAWVESLELVHEPRGTDWFGFSVAISGDWIAVGAPQDDDLGTNSGSTAVFKLRSTSAVPNPSSPAVFLPPVLVSLLFQAWIPFDPTRRSPGLTNTWVPLFLLP